MLAPVHGCARTGQVSQDRGGSLGRLGATAGKGELHCLYCIDMTWKINSLEDWQHYKFFLLYPEPALFSSMEGCEPSKSGKKA